MSNFKKLSAINIKDLIAKKGKHSYLSWASAWSLIKEEFPTTQRLVYENEHTGLNYFTDGTSAYVKVGITIEGLEHIDYLPIMDYRNQSIKIDKVTSMDVNTAIQRSTAKAIAMHGLGLSLWIGEDLTKSIAEPLVTKKAETESKESLDIILNIGDENWATVLKYVVANKTIGLPKIIKNLETKYSIKASVKKELSKKV
jgi:hypothetical protein|tara:strand:+ start:937 stop:1533 length:597 start_codon:yes stop_codon:yes gene_type:complete